MLIIKRVSTVFPWISQSRPKLLLPFLAYASSLRGDPNGSQLQEMQNLDPKIQSEILHVINSLKTAGINGDRLKGLLELTYKALDGIPYLITVHVIRDITIILALSYICFALNKMKPQK